MYIYIYVYIHICMTLANSTFWAPEVLGKSHQISERLANSWDELLSKIRLYAGMLGRHF